MSKPWMLLATALAASLPVDCSAETAAPPSPIHIEHSAAGEWHAVATNYEITLAADGTVRALVVGGVELVSTAAFLDEKNHPVPFESVRLDGENQIVCAAPPTEVRFTFFPDRIEMRRTNAGARFTTWAWTPSPAVTRSLDSIHDAAGDLTKQPFDGYQISPRWFTAPGGPIAMMPTLQWQNMPERSPAHGNVAMLSHGYEEDDRTPWVIRPIVKPRAADALVLDVRCADPNFMLPGGAPVKFDVGMTNASRDAAQLTAKFRVLNYLDRSEIAAVTKPLNLSAAASTTCSFETPITDPGVYRADLTIFDGDRETRRIDWVFVYDWDHWRPPPTRPADFSQFWKSTLDEMRSHPLDPVLTPQPALNGFQVFKVNFRALGDHRVYGWYIRPPGDGPFPAVIELPGNGVYNMGVYKTPFGRYAMLLIQVHGYDVDLSNYPTASPPWPRNNYWSVWPSRDEAFARVVYTNCVRGLDFLFSQKEVDPNNVFVAGGSQGGGLAITTAALEPRVKGVSVSFPGLCRPDWVYTHYLNAPFPWAGHDPKPESMSRDEFLRILSYYDAANFAQDIQCPVIGLSALKDEVTLGGSGLCALRHVTTPLTIVNAPWMNHRSDDRTNQANIEWLKRYLIR